MGDHYRTKIESEMDRFEAEISSIGRPPHHVGAPQVGGPAFIPAQLRRHPTPAAQGSSAGSTFIAAPPVINRPPAPQVTISGAPQVYRPPSIVRPRVPIPQSTTIVQRGVRPMIRPTTDAVITGQPTFSARPVLTAPPPIGSSVSPQVFSPGSQSTMPIPGMGVNSPASIVGTPMLTTPISSIPLPPEHASDPKPSTSTGEDGDDKGKNKKKKDKKSRKLVRSAGGSVWEDPSLQDWDPSDFRLFCGDLGNDVTDEVLTRVFGRYPSFQKARVIRDKRTNKTKGYGFVSFKDPNDFVRAVKELDGRYVGSRPIKLRKSNWKNRNLDVVKKRDQERMQLLGIKKPKLF